MDAILQFLIDWGYWGLFLGSFIAGSVLPFRQLPLYLALQHCVFLQSAVSLHTA